ncbi:hypothetical protein GCM10018955_26130 [Planomonospora venezuelensis]
MALDSARKRLSSSVPVVASGSPLPAETPSPRDTACGAWRVEAAGQQACRYSRGSELRGTPVKEEAGKDWANTGLVFTTKSGRPIEPRNLARSFTRIVETNGLFE